MSQKKLVSILLVLIVLVGIGYVVFNQLVQNTEQVTTGNWKTYSNNEYGFEIQVPSDWQVTVGKGNSSSFGAVAFDSKENREVTEENKSKDTGGNPSNITFFYYADVKKAAGYDLTTGTFAEYLKNSQDQDSFIKSQKISFVGQDAYRGVETGMYDTDAIWFERGGHFYKILLQNDRGMDSQLSAQILSTFKFVK